MRLWPLQGVTARMIALTLVALVVVQLVGYLSFRGEREQFVSRIVTDYMAQSVQAVDRALALTAPTRAEAMVGALSSRIVAFDLSAHAPACARATPRSKRLAAGFAERLGVSETRVRVCIGQGLMPGAHETTRRSVALGYARGPDEWLVVHQRLPGARDRWPRNALRNTLITLAIMSVLVVLVSRRFTRPLRELARAAERFGRGQAKQYVPERGGKEIRQSIAAFNRMQERIDRFVAERSRIVAALAHDLRTPITALRLRLEFLADDDNTRAMRATLDDLAEMSEATLTFMRAETAIEATRRVDLAALVDALCEDYRAADRTVTFSPDARVIVACRPTAIRRALRNVIDNALAYGHQADIALVTDAAMATIVVADRGPGIAAADRDTVFDAFVRLEGSRSRQTGGAGLGLAIARSVMRGHGGDITLHERAGGGLEARLAVPIG
ncbi:HAMP domain-containing sensor histidine kinase [Salinisphaera japonica]|uniref:HAMP domain-containing sensor histidine kinase n=1 Tax=Salinisphaera japonica TaxID=1304270 RepID=UPI001FEC931E|nr:HAMP domain-containing sensor histidine kinase [Salinisphaera japonica]